MGNFDYTRKDRNGDVPDQRLIGKHFQHENGHIYTVTGFTWIGDTDEWGVVHSRRQSDVVFTRSLRNFYQPGRYVPG